MDTRTRQLAATLLVFTLVEASPPVADDKHLHTHNEPKEDLAAMRGERIPSAGTTSVAVAFSQVIVHRRPPGTP